MGHSADLHPTLAYLMALVGAEILMRHWEQIMELRGIEQATFDREFWELVADAG